MLLGVWQSLLPNAAVGCDDDFFALGGNSLLLARLHSKIKAECGVSIPLGTLFSHRNIAAQAAIIESFLAVSRAEDALDEDVVEEEL